MEKRKDRNKKKKRSKAKEKRETRRKRKIDSTKKNEQSMLRSFLYVTIICTFAIVSIIYETKVNEYNYIQNYIKQQQLLVNEIASEAESYMISDKSEDLDLIESSVIENIIKRLEESGNRYWIFAKDNKIIFEKNNEVTNSTQGTSFEEISNENEIISVQNFEVNNNKYLIARCTDKSYALSVGKINEHNTYLYLIVGILCSVFLISKMGYFLKTKEKEDKIEVQKKQINKKNLLIDALSSKVEYQEKVMESENIAFDSLTKTYNSKFLENLLEKINSRGINPVVIVVFSISNFFELKDIELQDKALIFEADLINNRKLENYIITRKTNNEIIVIIVDSRIDEANKFANKICCEFKEEFNALNLNLFYGISERKNSTEDINIIVNEALDHLNKSRFEV